MRPLSNSVWFTNLLPLTATAHPRHSSPLRPPPPLPTTSHSLPSCLLRRGILRTRRTRCPARLRSSCLLLALILVLLLISPSFTCLIPLPALSCFLFHWSSHHRSFCVCCIVMRSRCCHGHHATDHLNVWATSLQKSEGEERPIAARG